MCENLWKAKEKKSNGNCAKRYSLKAWRFVFSIVNFTFLCNVLHIEEFLKNWKQVKRNFVKREKHKLLMHFFKQDNPSFWDSFMHIIYILMLIFVKFNSVINNYPK